MRSNSTSQIFILTFPHYDIISGRLKCSVRGVSSALGVLCFVDKLKAMAKINHDELNLISCSSVNEKVGCFVLSVQVSYSKTHILENGDL